MKKRLIKKQDITTRSEKELTVISNRENYKKEMKWQIRLKASKISHIYPETGLWQDEMETKLFASPRKRWNKITHYKNNVRDKIRSTQCQEKWKKKQ